MTNGNEFGRRRPPAQRSAAEKTPATEGEPRIDAVEVLFSPLVGQLAGVVGGVLIVLLLAGMYVSSMKSMGRGLAKQWEGKVIHPSGAEPNFQELSNRHCEIRSFNPEFRKLQRELGC